MKKYLVLTNGQSYLINADEISMEPSGVIKMFEKGRIIVAFHMEHLL